MATFTELHPVLQALLATLFTWGLTAAGAAVVFATTGVGVRLLSVMNGFAAGVMLAASYWSLLAPSIEMAAEIGQTPWLVAVLGFVAGAASLAILDKCLPHLHPGLPVGEAEGPRTRLRRGALLTLAITLHNIPEGLAVGVAFGAVAADLPSASLGAAVALALGIGLQNFPEGLAVALPLRAAGLSRSRAFLWGQASAVVEPVAGVLGALAVGWALPILPWALAWAAGAMVFVVLEELIPGVAREGQTDLATMAAVAGFAVMMALDVGLG
jgi:ZIP family zinc transporter